MSVWGVKSDLGVHYTSYSGRGGSSDLAKLVFTFLLRGEWVHVRAIRLPLLWRRSPPGVKKCGEAGKQKERKKISS